MSSPTPSPTKERSSKKAPSRKPSKKSSEPVSKKTDYVTPFTFDKTRLQFGKPTLIQGSANGKPYEFYQPTIKYRYPSGSIGELCIKFKEIAEITTIIINEETRNVDCGDKKEEIKFKKLVACLAFDPNLPKEDKKKYLYQEDAERDEMISHAELIKGTLEFYEKKLIESIAEWANENIPYYVDKKMSTVLDYGETSIPNYPKDKETKKKIETRPKQIYYDIKSYPFYDKNKKEIITSTASVKTINGTKLDWSELISKIIEGDIYVTLNRISFRTSGWSIKGSIDPVVVTNLRNKEKASDQRLQESIDEYKNNKKMLENMARLEQELNIERLRRKNEKIIESTPKQQLENEGTSGTTQLNVDSEPESKSDDEGEDDIRKMLGV